MRSIMTSQALIWHSKLSNDFQRLCNLWMVFIICILCLSTHQNAFAKPEKSQDVTVDYDIRDDYLSIQEIDQAESLFFGGFVAYQQKNYERAAELFQQAYAIVPYHDLLFNVARSREQLGDKEGSIQWYRAYLATKPIDETTVIHRLKLLGGDPTPKPLESTTPNEKPVDREYASVSIIPWITFGAGVLLAGVGTYYGLSALDEATAARDAATKSKWSLHKQEAESAALTADITYSIGAIALLAGVYLWLQQDGKEGNLIKGDTDVKKSSSLTPPLHLALTPDGARVGYRWSF